MSKSYYLDTSAVRSHLIGHSSIKTYLLKKLEGKNKITSPFVKMEFERSFICNLIEFYFALRYYTCIDDAIKWWAEEFKPRKLKDIDFSIAAIFSGLKDRNDMERAKLNLRDEIKKIITLFGIVINRFDNNNTSCYFSNVQLNLDYCDTKEEAEKAFVEFYQEYDKKNRVDKCKIIDFFDSNKEILKKIREYSSKDAKLNSQKEGLEEIFQQRRKLSCATCSIVGDTIIALECPQYAILLASDTVFNDLCKLIGIKCEIVPSVRSLNPIKEVLKLLKTPFGPN